MPSAASHPFHLFECWDWHLFSIAFILFAHFLCFYFWTSWTIGVQYFNMFAKFLLYVPSHVFWFCRKKSFISEILQQYNITTWHHYKIALPHYSIQKACFPRVKHQYENFRHNFMHKHHFGFLHVHSHYAFRNRPASTAFATDDQPKGELSSKIHDFVTLQLPCSSCQMVKTSNGVLFKNLLGYFWSVQHHCMNPVEYQRNLFQLVEHLLQILLTYPKSYLPLTSLFSSRLITFSYMNIIEFRIEPYLHENRETLFDISTPLLEETFFVLLK